MLINGIQINGYLRLLWHVTVTIIWLCLLHIFHGTNL